MRKINARRHLTLLALIVAVMPKVDQSSAYVSGPLQALVDLAPAYFYPSNAMPAVRYRPTSMTLYVSIMDIAAPFAVEVYDEHPSNGGEILTSLTISPSSTWIYVPITITPTHVGTRTIVTVIDPGNLIVEASESNNVISATLAVREPNATWYVDATALPGGDGKAPDRAFRTITESLPWAVDGDVIRVGAGVYPSNFTIPPGVALRGSGRDHTRLEGTGILGSLSMGANATLSDVTLQSATPVSGTGIYMGDSGRVLSSTLRGFVYAISAFCGKPGGCFDASVFENNVFDRSQQAINLSAVPAIIANNTFYSTTVAVNTWGYAPAVLASNVFLQAYPFLRTNAAPISATNNIVFPQFYDPSATGGFRSIDPLLRDPLVGDFRPYAASPVRNHGPGVRDIGAIPFAPRGVPPTDVSIGKNPVTGWNVSWKANDAVSHRIYLVRVADNVTSVLASGPEGRLDLPRLFPDTGYRIAVTGVYSDAGESELSEKVELVTAPIPPGNYEESSDYIFANQAWKAIEDARASGGSLFEAQPGARIEFVFRGDQLVIVRPVRASASNLKVIIDGSRQYFIYSNSPVERWRVPAVIDGLGPGRHAVRIEADTGARLDALLFPGDFRPNAAQQAAITRINFHRLAAGLPPAVGVMAIHMAAQAHAEFVANNQNDPRVAGLGFHRELADLPGYTGEWPTDRSQLFGYDGGVGEDGHFMGSPTASVDGWMATLYHRNMIMCYGCVDTGYGKVNDGRGRFDSLSMGSRTWIQAPVRRLIYTYPASGQANVPVEWNGAEIPDPLPNKPKPVGYPISMYVIRNGTAASQLSQLRSARYRLDQEDVSQILSTQATSWTLQFAELRNLAGELVPSYVIDMKNDAPRYLGPDNAFIVPEQPLKPGMTYVARFVGKDSMGEPFDVRSSFSTGAEPPAIMVRPVATMRVARDDDGVRIDAEIQITATGGVPRDLTMLITLPRSASLIDSSVSTSVGAVDTGIYLTWTVPSLAPGQIARISYALRLIDNGAPQPIYTTAQVFWDTGMLTRQFLYVLNAKTMWLPVVSAQ